MLAVEGVAIDVVPYGPDELDEAITSGTIVLEDRVKEYEREVAATIARRERETTEIKAAVKQLPSKYQMVKNLGRHALTVAKHYKKTGRVYVSDEHRESRLSICRPCEYSEVIDDSLRCKQKSCGCHLDGDLGKTRFEVLTCPIGKHDETDKQFLQESQS